MVVARMMFPSHVLGALLLGGLWAFARPFSPRDWRLALGFAVAIDLDHVVQFPRYVMAAGTGGLEPGAMLRWGEEWQGFMHDATWGVPIALGASLLARSLVPLVFWLLHMAQDFVVATRFVVFGSLEEWLVVGALALAVAVVFVAQHRLARDARSLVAHVALRFGVPLPGRGSENHARDEPGGRGGSASPRNAK